MLQGVLLWGSPSEASARFQTCLGLSPAWEISADVGTVGGVAVRAQCTRRWSFAGMGWRAGGCQTRRYLLPDPHGEVFCAVDGRVDRCAWPLRGMRPVC